MYMSESMSVFSLYEFVAKHKEKDRQYMTI